MTNVGHKPPDFFYVPDTCHPNSVTSPILTLTRTLTFMTQALTLALILSPNSVQR